MRDAGVDLGAPCDRWGGTPAKYAVLEEQPECLKALFLAGVDLRAPCDPYGAPPRALALTQESHELVALIDAMLLPPEQKPWKCRACSVENRAAASECELCGEPAGKKGSN